MWLGRFNQWATTSSNTRTYGLGVFSLYGCDIILDNIDECRIRLLKVIVKYKKVKISKKEIVKILLRNIVHTPLYKYPNGSLDYLSLPEDKTFNKNLREKWAQKKFERYMSLIDEVNVE